MESMFYWMLLTVVGLTGFIWSLHLLQLVTRGRDMEFRITANDDPDAPTDGALVSIIIPARNEEGNIGQCLATVRDQTYKNIEVIVLNDRSDDGTQAEIEAAAQKDSRVRGVMGRPRPDGWMGKVWACHVAQQQANGEVLLFIDADVRLTPEAVRQSLAYLNRTDLEALSIFGRLTMVSFWEWTVQPIIGGLIVQNNDPRDVNDPDKPDKVIANGQFIMARRGTYDAFGGHESIKGEILDDVSFARRCKENGHRYHVVYGRQLFDCRMYHSLSEIWEGWTKNLFAGLDYKLAFTLLICQALFILNIVPYLTLLGSIVAVAMGALTITDPLLWVSALNVALTYIVYIGGMKIADQPIHHFWTFPLGMLVTIGLFANSALKIATGQGVSWKGRTYVKTSTRQHD